MELSTHEGPEVCGIREEYALLIYLALNIAIVAHVIVWGSV